MISISRVVAIVALCVLGAGTAMLYREHLVGLGVAQESAQRDEIDKQRDGQAKIALAQANGKVASLQAQLNALQTQLNQQGKEVADAQAHSAALQSDLAAGRRQLRVAIAGPCSAAQTEHDQGTAAAGMDTGSRPATADLDGRAAADLEWVRQTRNDALDAVQACTAAYDAVRAASN
ncbi:lysis system i-spanin subunit Rz [Massilia sp. 9096]|uniref:lysis system i-spanin subunit Rz n=1 Tax=Massilia sp. 9096 TaxID=1500894 RepID=UPI0012E01360|nr:lysis system i-spanin subunit Rz [Massilia sp. 9096]